MSLSSIKSDGLLAWNASVTWVPAWQIVRASGYVPTPDADPAHLYADLLVGIIPERRLNNGMPSYHALLMAQAAIQPGEHIVHIGAGVGYYIHGNIGRTRRRCHAALNHETAN
jgi:hypothetical protein